MLPLTGVKVVEFANNIAGPYASYILAMLGADVLKVERPEGGDDARSASSILSMTPSVFASTSDTHSPSSNPLP